MLLIKLNLNKYYFKRNLKKEEFNYIEENFTAKLEEQLDAVANGKMLWKETLEKWWIPFKTAISKTNIKP